MQNALILLGNTYCRNPLIILEAKKPLLEAVWSQALLGTFTSSWIVYALFISSSTLSLVLRRRKGFIRHRMRQQYGNTLKQHSKTRKKKKTSTSFDVRSYTNSLEVAPKTHRKRKVWSTSSAVNRDKDLWFGMKNGRKRWLIPCTPNRDFKNKKSLWYFNPDFLDSQESNKACKKIQIQS